MYLELEPEPTLLIVGDDDKDESAVSELLLPSLLVEGEDASTTITTITTSIIDLTSIVHDNDEVREPAPPQQQQTLPCHGRRMVHFDVESNQICPIPSRQELVAMASPYYHDNLWYTTAQLNDMRCEACDIVRTIAVASCSPDTQGGGGGNAVYTLTRRVLSSLQDETNGWNWYDAPTREISPLLHQRLIQLYRLARDEQLLGLEHHLLLLLRMMNMNHHHHKANDSSESHYNYHDNYSIHATALSPSRASQAMARALARVLHESLDVEDDDYETEQEEENDDDQDDDNDLL
ncbi:hypothetical protein ACA910_013760 [Epithemia clementina (nom. ined.)]